MNEFPEASREAFRWLGQAMEDLDTARHVQRDPNLPGRISCFLAHLAVEKALKALLINAGTPFPKTHDLVRLYKLIPHDRRPELELAHLELLNPWAIDGRYAAHAVDASHEIAAELVTKAAQILMAVQNCLEAKPADNDAAYTPQSTNDD